MQYSNASQQPYGRAANTVTRAAGLKDTRRVTICNELLLNLAPSTMSERGGDHQA
jgi:hypothetical protein